MPDRAVVLPDGRVVAASDEDAKKARLKEESVEAGVQRHAGAVAEDRFGGAADTALTVLEGIGSGLTLGLSDLWADEQTRARAKVNPLPRGVGEFTGAILPSLINPASTAGRVMRASPAGLVTRGAEKVREGFGGIKGTIAQGAIEGIGGGLGQAVSNAALSSDPLTVDAAIESAGLGGLIGGGLGAIAGGLGLAGRVSTRAQERAAAKVNPFDQVMRESLERRVSDIDVQLAATPDVVRLPADKAVESRLAAIDDELSALQTTTPNADGARRRLEQIDAELSRRASDKAAGVGDFAPPIADDAYLSLRQAADIAVENGRSLAAGRSSPLDEAAGVRTISPKEYRRAARAAGDDILGQLQPEQFKQHRAAVARLKKAWGRLDADPADFEHAREHADAVADLAKRAGAEPLPMPSHPADTAFARTKQAAAMADADVEMAASALKSLPKSVASFGRMSEASRSHLVRTLQNVAEKEWGTPLRDALDQFRTGLGVTEGSLSEGVNRMYRDHADTISGRLEKLLTAEKRAVERQMKAAASGSAADVESARRALIAEKGSLIGARRTAETTARETADAVKKALKEERRLLTSDLRGLADPAEPRTAAKHSDSWVKRIGAGAAAFAVGGPAGVVAEISGLRRAITSRVAGLIARKGETAERAIRRLGSPAARLGVSFLGHEDEDARGKTNRELAARRTDELLKLRPAVRDAAYAIAAPLAADAGQDFALELANRMAAAVDHLVQYLPRDPGTARHLLSSDWLPSDAQAEELAVRLEAAAEPLTALDRLLAGDVDPAAAETLWALWPGVMTEARDELLAALPEMGDVSMGTVAGLSAAFRTPFDGLLMPHNVAHLQNMYGQPSEPQGAGTTQKPQSQGGRPAATDQLTHAQSLTA